MQDEPPHADDYTPAPTIVRRSRLNALSPCLVASKRLMARNNLTAEEAWKRIRSQVTNTQRIARADRVSPPREPSDLKSRLSTGSRQRYGPQERSRGNQVSSSFLGDRLD
jgi:hypothetical protein